MTPAGVRAAVDVSVPVSRGHSVYLDTPALSATGASAAKVGAPASPSSSSRGRKGRVPGAGVKRSDLHSPRTRSVSSGAFMRRFSGASLMEDSSPSVKDSVKRVSRNVVRAAAKHLHNSKLTSVLSGSPSSRPPSGLAGSPASSSKRAKQVARVHLDFAMSASADRTPDGYNGAGGEQHEGNASRNRMELSGDGGGEGEFVDGNCREAGAAGRPHEPGADGDSRKEHSPSFFGSSVRRSKRLAVPVSRFAASVGYAGASSDRAAAPVAGNARGPARRGGRSANSQRAPDVPAVDVAPAAASTAVRSAGAEAVADQAKTAPAVQTRTAMALRRVAPVAGPASAAAQPGAAAATPAVAAAISGAAVCQPPVAGVAVAATPRLRRSSRHRKSVMTVETAKGPSMCVCNRPEFGDICHCYVCDAAFHCECVGVSVGEDYECESCLLNAELG